MAYALRFDGVGQHANMAAYVKSARSDDDFEFRLVVAFHSTKMQPILGRHDGWDRSWRCSIDGELLFHLNNTTNVALTDSGFFLFDSAFHEYTVIRDSIAEEWRGYRDGGLVSTVTGHAHMEMNWLRYVGRSRDQFADMSLKEFDFWGTTGDGFHLKLIASLANGTGNTLFDEFGIRNCDLPSPMWPTDDSQWISTGGAVAPVLSSPFASGITTTTIVPNVTLTF